MDMEELDRLTHKEMVYELQSRLQQQEREFIDAIAKAVLTERRACAADVCPRCAAGDERETNGSGWFHRQPDQFAGHLYSACPAAPIHARVQAQAEKEA